MKNKIAVALNVVLALTVLLTACMTDAPEEKVTVTFDAQGGTPAPGPVTITRGEKLGSVTTPTRGTDDFIGWYNGFDRYTADTVITGDITLTAKWKAEDTAEYVLVTFESPDGIPAVDAIEVGVGKAVGPLFPVDPIRQGYRFDGWEYDDDGTPVEFTKTAVITAPVTVTAAWSAKATYTVTLQVPAIHSDYNLWGEEAEEMDENYVEFPAEEDDGEGNMVIPVHGTKFTVYEDDGIDYWEQRFPAELLCAPDPDVNRYHRFFMWTDDGTRTGIIYNERTPITGDVTLTGYYGLNFHPKTFDVVLSTMNQNTVVTGGSGTTVATPVRTPLATGAVYSPVEDTATATFTETPSFMYFHCPVALRPLLDQASVANESQFAFEVEYEYVGTEEEIALWETGAMYNFMFANLAQGDNWNATAVVNHTLKELSEGILNEQTDEYEPAVHDTAGTITSFGANKNWLVIRGGRGEANAKVIFKSIKVHLLQ